MILLIDNYDSFAHNLGRYLVRLGLETVVKRNDALSVTEVRALNPTAVVLSPGPGFPEDAGISVTLVREIYREIPLLGICLGHQAIVTALGGSIARSGSPMHGRTSQIYHDGTPMFAGVPTPFKACRYHSLIVKQSDVPENLQVTARSEDGTIMAVEHRTHPLVGLQFHPESILTMHGYQLLSNFLRLAEVDHSTCPDDKQTTEMKGREVAVPELPKAPVTF